MCAVALRAAGMRRKPRCQRAVHSPETHAVSEETRHRTFADRTPTPRSLLSPMRLTGDTFTCSKAIDAGEHVGQFEFFLLKNSFGADTSRVLLLENLKIAHRGIRLLGI